MSITEQAAVTIRAAVDNRDDVLAQTLEDLSPDELLRIHRAAHRVAMEAAQVRRRKRDEATKAQRLAS